MYFYDRYAWSVVPAGTTGWLGSTPGSNQAPGWQPASCHRHIPSKVRWRHG